MSQKTSVGHILEKFGALCPSGYAIGLHIKFSTPKYLFQTYAREWVEIYSSKGLILQDPTVHWGFANVGTIRWDVLAANDAAGVIKLAAEHGKKFGFTAAMVSEGSRSIASFTRPTHDFTDDEITAITGDLEVLHADTLGTEALSPADHAALKSMSVHLVHS